MKRNSRTGRFKKSVKIVTGKDNEQKYIYRLLSYRGDRTSSVDETILYYESDKELSAEEWANTVALVIASIEKKMRTSYKAAQRRFSLEGKVTKIASWNHPRILYTSHKECTFGELLVDHTDVLDDELLSLGFKRHHLYVTRTLNLNTRTCPFGERVKPKTPEELQNHVFYDNFFIDRVNKARAALKNLA